MSLFLDIVTLAILLGGIAAAYRKGLVRSAVELAGYVLSSVVAYSLSVPLGQWIYNSLLEPVVSRQVHAYIAKTVGDGAGAAVTSSGLSTFLNRMPDNFRALLGQYHLSVDTIRSAAGSSAQSGTDIVSTAVTNQIAAPIAMSVSRAIAFAAVFFVCMIVVRLVARVANGVNRIPVIGTINRFGGACAGLLLSAMDIFLLCTVISVVISVLSFRQNPPLTVSTVDNTAVFKIFYSHNPFTLLLLNK